MNKQEINIEVGRAAEKLQDALAKFDVPDHCRQGLVMYMTDGAPVGGFLTAVLQNDLVGAFNAADATNSRSLLAYATVLYAAFPGRNTAGGCWGSEEAMNNWQSIGGLRGYLTSTGA